jgi:hypothetical protein
MNRLGSCAFAALLLLSACAESADTPTAIARKDLAPDWRVQAAVPFALTEERSATPATDGKAITIRQDIAVVAANAADGARTLRWTATNPQVEPNATRVKRSIPQLRDSLLFEPSFTLVFTLDANGRYAAIANAAEVGAAMRRGFGAPEDLEHPFFAQITSTPALEGAVAKIPIAMIDAVADAKRLAAPVETPVNLPGTELRIGTQRDEVVADRKEGRVHFRRTRSIERKAANAAMAQFEKTTPLPVEGMPDFEADLDETVDVVYDPRTGAIEELAYAQATEMAGTPLTMTVRLVRGGARREADEDAAP